MNRRMTSIGLIAVAALVIGVPADARDDIVTLKKTVRFDDLNLQSEAGWRTLYARIRTAARDVCLQGNETRGLERVNYYSCVSKAIDDAVVKMHQPMLTAIHASRVARPSS